MHVGVLLAYATEGVEIMFERLLPQMRVNTIYDINLHALKEKLDVMLARENRAELAAACFGFLPYRARLDLSGWAAEDIFAHS